MPRVGTRQRTAEFFLKLRRVPDHDTRRRKLTLPSAADLALGKAAVSFNRARPALSLSLSFSHFSLPLTSLSLSRHRRTSPAHASAPATAPPRAGPRGLRPGHRASPPRAPRHCRREEEEAGEKRGGWEKRGGEGEGEEKEGAGLGPSTLTPLRSSPPSSPTLVVAILVAKVCPTPVVVSSST